MILRIRNSTTNTDLMFTEQRNVLLPLMLFSLYKSKHKLQDKVKEQIEKSQERKILEVHLY